MFSDNKAKAVRVLAETKLASDLERRKRNGTRSRNESNETYMREYNGGTTKKATGVMMIRRFLDTGVAVVTQNTHTRARVCRLRQRSRKLQARRQPRDEAQPHAPKHACMHPHCLLSIIQKSPGGYIYGHEKQKLKKVDFF